MTRTRRRSPWTPLRALTALLLGCAVLVPAAGVAATTSPSSATTRSASVVPFILVIGLNNR